MTETNMLTEEEQLRIKEKFSQNRLPSNAKEAPAAKVNDQLLPDDRRGKMPFTKGKYLVKENPDLVAWERELRKFLRNLSPLHEHRISAVMVYEWATGNSVAELQAAGGSANAHLRKLNALMKQYFGEPYMTWIMGRKVPRAYKVPSGWYVRRHRPKTLTLYAEYSEGTLNP